MFYAKLTKYFFCASIIMIFAISCRDNREFRLRGYRSSLEVMREVEMKRNILHLINAKYKKNGKGSLYPQIDYIFEATWASPEIMCRWYKIWLESLKKGKAEDKLINRISCQALVWFIRANDIPAIESLPVLKAYPLLEEAKQKFLKNKHKEFAAWAREHFNIHTIPNIPLCVVLYCGLLESAALAANDYELACEANMILYKYGQYFDDFAASNLSLYILEKGKINDVEISIIKDYYKTTMKGVRLTNIMRKREDCILKVIKKYKLIPKIDVLPRRSR